MADQIERLRVALAERYDIVRPLGQGGMAFVYLAQDRKHDRPVALKLLKPELSATIGAERFLREIRVAAQLQHPNILGLYDSGDADGLLYYVMPFVEGESLRDRLNREQQLPIDEALRMTREAAEALEYAHGRGVVHRDIKPENILVQGGHALVADFGIAKAVQSAASQKLTETGMAVGTPHYMSPEQSLGGELDGRSDIYSLGCVLYELLAGQPPFDGPNAMAVIARHSLEQVPSLQVVRASIPDEVEDAVFRALEKTPADRYQHMRDFAEDLLESESVFAIQRTSARRAAGTPRTPQQVPIATRRTTAKVLRAGGVATPLPGQVDDPPVPAWRRPAFLVAGLLVLVLAVGVVARKFVAGGGSPSGAVAAVSDDAKRVAVLYFQSPPGSDSLRFLADGLTEGLIGALAEVRDLEVTSRNGSAQFRGRNVPRDSIAAALKVGTLVEGGVEQDGDRIRVTVRLVDAASGAEFQRASFEQPAGSYLALGDTLAQRAALFLRERLGVEVRLREQRLRASSPEAWVQLQRAEAIRKRADSLMRLDPAAASLAYADADSLLADAARRDPRWPDPLIMRAAIASQEVRLANRDAVKAAAPLERGLRLADSAVALDPQNSGALFRRGDLRYWRFLLGLEADPTERKKLLAAAQADFETATKLNPAEAPAWASLAHLYNQNGTLSEVNLAARRAYEADAFLANIDGIINRLFNSSYDLGQFADAEHWCSEGAQRFPDDYRFTMCRLLLLSTRAKEPDVARAWRLRDSVATLAPEAERAFRTRGANLAVAAVIARAGLADSARAVVGSSRSTTDIDPNRDLLFDEAFVHTLLGDPDAAIRALKGYWAANPDRQAGMVEDPGWQFQALQSDARWPRTAKP